MTYNQIENRDQPYHTIGIPVGEPITITKPKESWYIFQVLNLVFIQLLTTSSIAVGAYLKKEAILSYLQKDSGVIWLPIILSFVSLICLSCAKKNRILAYIIFAIFTLSMASMLSIAILPYSPAILMKALAATSTSVLIVNSYAYYCAKKNIDFTYLGPALFGTLMGIIVISIFQIFIQSTILAICLAIIGTILFTLYLLYDLNRLYNRTEEFETDPLVAAISIYLDIINMFLYILQLFQFSNEN